MPITDPALGFFLRYAAREGALREDGEESSFVVLPDEIRAAFGLPEETVVTADPEVAREDGAVLMVPGHPALNGAAERVLAAGDAGTLRLAWPARVPPSPEVLLARARDQFPVDHGRIDATGGPRRVLLPALRVGTLVQFTVSMEVGFCEQVECWVDGRSGLAIRAEVRRALAAAAVEPGGQPAASAPASVAPDLARSVAAAHTLIARQAEARSIELSAEATGSRDAEIARARAYYAEALASIARRRKTAAPDRAQMLDARAEATRAERVRRINEIEEKYRSQVEIRPIRLHLVEVPGLELPVDVLRGPRRYPLLLHWILPAGSFADVRCPSCGSPASLVAGKDRLGCADCH
jgi:hypothetical protein